MHSEWTTEGGRVLPSELLPHAVLADVACCVTPTIPQSWQGSECSHSRNALLPYCRSVAARDGPRFFSAVRRIGDFRRSSVVRFTQRLEE